MITQNDFLEQVYTNKETIFKTFPDRELAEKFINTLYEFLFLKKTKNCSGLECFKQEFAQLETQLYLLIDSVLEDKSQVQPATETFFKALPECYQKLMADANAILQFDPAAQSLEEVLTAYPGFYATYIYRISHQLALQQIKTLPRILSEYAHSCTAIDIHPSAQIGCPFFIDHGTGIVIGQTAIIGNNVKIYQGVTLGALSVSKDLAFEKRHPTIQDNVTIYAGATILGGNTIIGKGSIIGGNAWLTRSVEENSVVYHQSEIKIKGSQPFDAILDFVI